MALEDKRFENFTHFDPAYLMADSFQSTATTYETTEVDASDVILDMRAFVGMKVAINVTIEAISSVGTETYSLKVEDGDLPDFSVALRTSYEEIIDKNVALGQLKPLIVIVPQYGYIRAQVKGANSPDWTLTIWAAPAQ